MKPQNKVKIKWSPEFAYAIGLIATDGSLSIDGRHISFTSKDKELVGNFQKCLGTNLHVGRKSSSSVGVKKYYVVQIGDVSFYRFLMGLGLTPNKTKTIGPINIPTEYFLDFIRGHMDGDGSFYSYYDPRWKSSYMFYASLVSASKQHILWLKSEIKSILGIKGYISKSKNDSIYQLKYAKAESLKLLPKLYYHMDVVCLSRKRQKIEKALKVINFKL